MNEKLKKMMFIVLACFFVLFLFLFLLTSCKKRYGAKDFEIEIVKKVSRYYSLHTDELPSEGGIITLTLEDLVSKNIIKNLDKILKKGTTCSGTMIIENNNNNYMYSPTLSCSTGRENYASINLKEELLNNVVTSGNGMYNLGTKYVFKGDNVNNYLIFDGILWHIMGINEEGYIRIIEVNKRPTVVWDNRYNNEKTATVGINDLINNGLNSRIKDTLDSIYETEDVFSEEGKGYIKKTSLCIGKRNEDDLGSDASYECSNKLENQYIGLIQVNEYALSSLDPNCVSPLDASCKNYNYLSTLPNSFWTLTADSATTHKVYKISNTVSISSANSYAMPRMVINISDNTNVTGTGTSDDPYIVLGFDSSLKKFN